MVNVFLQKMLRPVLAHSKFDLSLARLRLRDFGALGSELSAAFSLEDSPGQPNSRLIALALSSVRRAQDVELKLLMERKAPAYAHLWPGEHYKLLNALVQETKPRLILEIGTYTGLSALAMLAALPPEGRLVTVDIIPWQQIPGSFLRPSDFESGKLQQLVCDLGRHEVAEQHSNLLRNGDFFLVDASKDGDFEYRLMEQLKLVGLKPGALVVFDDIRFWNMLKLWREITQPKLDLSSFGHWSGTGLVDWGRSSRLYQKATTENRKGFRQRTNQG